MSEENSQAENKKAGWKATSGRLNVVPPQEDAHGQPVEVKLHEFRPAPPTPYIEQIRAYSQLLAAESGIPAPYLGFVTDNPSSADSIRQQEYRLVKRAERRRDRGVDPESFRKLGVSWRDASTPTRAAAADEAQKLIASQVLLPDSTVTYDRIGLTQQEQQQLERDKRGRMVRDLTAAIRERRAEVPGGAG